MARLSVILPTHDRPDCLRRAVDALFAQTRPPDELIIVDDGTSPLPKDLTGRLGRAGFTCRYERRELPSLPASCNRGMELATGDILVFTEDDVVLPDDHLARIEELYALDRREQVAAIGGVAVEPGPRSLGRRIVEALERAVPMYTWAPRVCAGRYVRLPGALRGSLLPARWAPGGVLSLRRAVARGAPPRKKVAGCPRGMRFDESFGGYAQAEDTDFACRLTRAHPLFVAPELRVVHDRAAGGRPDWGERGRTYAAHMLQIARRSVEPGAGTSLLLAWHLVGLVALYAGWIPAGKGREYLAWCRGLLGELRDQSVLAVERALFGRPAYERRHGEIFNPVEQRRLRAALHRAVTGVQTGRGQPVALDLGCGTGNLTAHLLEMGLRVVAGDVSGRALAAIRGRFGGTDRCTPMRLDAAEMSDLPNGCFDLVAAYSLLHHVPDYLAAVREMARVVRPGGVVLIDHETDESVWQPTEAYLRYVRAAAPPKSLLRLLNPRTYAHRLRRVLDPHCEPEGDLHVRADDHIEWDRVEQALRAGGCEVVHREAYLLRRRGWSVQEYERARGTCADMRMLITRKAGPTEVGA